MLMTEHPEQWMKCYSGAETNWKPSRLGVLATEGRVLLAQYAALTQEYLGRQWPVVRDSLAEIGHHLLLVAEQIRMGAITHIEPYRIYSSLAQLFRRPLHREFAIGVTFFTIGGVLGFYAASSMYGRAEKRVRYVQAVQCISYNSTGTTSTEGVAAVDDVPLPRMCGRKDVAISVHAGSLHMIDVRITKGYGRRLREALCGYNEYYKRSLPVTLGRDCTGIITGLGQDVAGFELGDAVWAAVPFTQNGLLSETVVVDCRYVTRKPKEFGFQAACSFPYAGVVALQALESAGITHESINSLNVLIVGGCTPVGCFLVQLLTAWGARVSAAGAQRAENVLRALGAEYIYTFAPDPDVSVAEQLGKQLDLITDLYDFVFVTNDLFTPESVDRYSRDGRVIDTRPPDIPSDSYGFFMGLCYSLALRIQCYAMSFLGDNMTESYNTLPLNQRTLGRVATLATECQIRPVVGKVFQAVDIELALAHAQSEQCIGSTVIAFNR